MDNVILAGNTLVQKDGFVPEVVICQPSRAFQKVKYDDFGFGRENQKHPSSPKLSQLGLPVIFKPYINSQDISQGSDP
ncbi:MAG: hypothetical protein ABJF50_20180 [Paracoccaceae bacterium]